MGKVGNTYFCNNIFAMFRSYFFEIKQKLILSDSIMTYDINDIRGFK